MLTATPCVRAASSIGHVSRSACNRSPPCGPAAVTSVPSTITASTPNHTPMTSRRVALGGRGRHMWVLARALEVEHRDTEQRDGEQEVGHHAEPLQVDLDRDATQHRFEQVQHEEHPAEPDEIAPPRSREIRKDQRDRDRYDDETRVEAVELLDALVDRAEAREVARLAARPVGAAESRVREPHDRAAHDDRAEHHHHHDGDDAIGAGGSRAIDESVLRGRTTARTAARLRA